jgi:hypothetical protein
VLQVKPRNDDSGRARNGELAAGGTIAPDRCHLVGKYTREARQVAGQVDIKPEIRRIAPLFVVTL